MSNTVYVAVASLYWTAFLTWTGQILLPDVQTAVMIIPASAGIAALLWVIELEGVVVSRLSLALVHRSYLAAWDRYVTALTALFLRPWQSSIDSVSSTIAKSQRNEMQRVLRSSLLSQDMESLHHLFWLELSLIPYTYLAGTIMPGLAGLMNGLGLVLGIVAFLCVLYRKRWPLGSISGLAYCNWYIAVVDQDEGNRKTITRLQQAGDYPVAGFRNIVRIRVEDLLKQAAQGDWMGFSDGHDALTTMMSSLSHETSALHIRSLVTDLLWTFEQMAPHEPLPAGVAIPFTVAFPLEVRAQARVQVLDALSEISSFEKADPKADWQSEIQTFLESWKHLDNLSKVYSILTDDMIRKLNQETVGRLAALSLRYSKGANIEGLAGHFGINDIPTKWSSELALFLFRAEDRKLLDAKTVVEAATMWHVWPVVYLSVYSVRVRKILAEEPMGIPAAEFRKVIEDLISRTSNLDPAKTAANIGRYRHDQAYREILEVLRGIGRSGKVYAQAAEDVLKGLDTSILSG